MESATVAVKKVVSLKSKNYGYGAQAAHQTTGEKILARAKRENGGACGVDNDLTFLRSLCYSSDHGNVDSGIP